MTEVMEQVEKRILTILECAFEVDLTRRDGFTQARMKQVKQILLIPELLIKAPNQSLPDNPKPNPPGDREEIIAHGAYGSAQQDMTTPDKDGYVWMKVMVK